MTRRSIVTTGLLSLALAVAAAGGAFAQEGDAVTPPGLSDALLRRMRVDNPLATYPRLKETVS